MKTPKVFELLEMRKMLLGCISLYKVIRKSLCTWHLQYSTQLMSWRRPSQNTFRMWTVLHWTRSSRTQFRVSINIWRLAGDTLNITCNFLYCNRQVHRDFLITLYIVIILSDNCCRSHCVTFPLSVCDWLAQGPMLISQIHWQDEAVCGS